MQWFTIKLEIKSEIARWESQQFVNYKSLFYEKPKRIVGRYDCNYGVSEVWVTYSMHAHHAFRVQSSEVLTLKGSVLIESAV
jgi:hypothetical protein